MLEWRPKAALHVFHISVTFFGIKDALVGDVRLRAGIRFVFFLHCFRICSACVFVDVFAFCLVFFCISIFPIFYRV